MKTLMTLILSCLLTFIYTELPFAIDINDTPLITESKQSKNVDKKLPLDLYKIMNEWKPLEIYPTEGSPMVMIVLGNPKIEWSEEKSHDYDSQPVPTGEITSAVKVILVAHESGKITMDGFYFIDTMGITNLYVYDKKCGSYTKRIAQNQMLV